MCRIAMDHQRSVAYPNAVADANCASAAVSANMQGPTCVGDFVRVIKRFVFKRSAGRRFVPILNVVAVLALLQVLVLPPSPAAARDGQSAGLRVAVTVKPLHSLVAAIMRGVGQPVLLYPNAAALNGKAATENGDKAKSDSGDSAEDREKSLKSFDVVFRVSAQFEKKLADTVKASADGPTMVSLMQAPGVRLIDRRPGYRRVGAPRTRAPRRANRRSNRRSNRQGTRGKKIKRGGITFRTRDGKKVIRTRRNGRRITRRTVQRSRGRSGTQRTVVAQPDPNIWLDPRNAIAMSRHIASVLIKQDPANARLYRRNVSAMIVTLEAMESNITGILRPLRTRRFAVLNNRLQYFEEHYLLRPAVELKLDLSAFDDAQASKIGKQLAEGSTRCILAPTSATAAQLRALQPNADSSGDKSSDGSASAGSRRRVFAIDPYGDAFDPGPEMYETMMRYIGESYGRCLSLSSAKKP